MSDDEWIAAVRREYSVDTKTGIVSRLHGQFAGPLASLKPFRGYIRLICCGRSIKAHRLVWALCYGELPQGALDHINGIRDDNRPENLRLADNVENSRNRRAYCCGKPKGVTRDRKRFRALIHLDSGALRLGTFDTPEEAAHAYNKAAVKFYGEFACLDPI